MDALIYTALSGAERVLRAQQVHANNLANIDTAGFRADLELATQQTVPGYGYDARVMSRLQADALTGRAGSVHETGRELDVAVQGNGYLTVEWGEGEAYTRAGSLSVDAEGALTVNGHAVIGDGGPIVLPEFDEVSIGQDGTISVRQPGQDNLQPIDRLKLVSAEASALTKNAAGLVVTRDGMPLQADNNITVRSRHLEGSNVSAVEEMIATMSLNRDFEMQMKLYKASDAMAEAGNRLIRE